MGSAISSGADAYYFAIRPREHGARTVLASLGEEKRRPFLLSGAGWLLQAHLDGLPKVAASPSVARVVTPGAQFFRQAKR